MVERILVQIPSKEEEVENVPLHGWRRGGANTNNREKIVVTFIEELKRHAQNHDMRQVLDDLIEAVMFDVLDQDPTHANSRLLSELELGDVLTTARKMKSKGCTDEGILRYVVSSVNKSVALLAFKLSK